MDRVTIETALLAFGFPPDPGGMPVQLECVLPDEYAGLLQDVSLHMALNPAQAVPVENIGIDLGLIAYALREVLPPGVGTHLVYLAGCALASAGIEKLSNPDALASVVAVKH